MITAVLVALLAPSRAVAVGAGVEAGGDDPVVLTVDDEEFERSRYAEWLLLARGEILAPRFARLWRLRRLADAAGVAVAPADCRARVVHELELRVENAFNGDRERWLAELRAEGRSPDGVLAERSLEVEGELLLAGVAAGRGVEPRVIEPELEGRVDFMPRALLATGDEVPVLAIDGVEVERAEYLDWLVRAHGELEARRLAETVRIERAAAAAGFEVGAEEVERRVEADTERIIQHDHGGDHAAWVRALTAAGRTEEQYAREAARRTRLDLLVEKLVLRDRVVPDAAVRAEWQRAFGRDGVRIELRWIRLDAETPADLERARAEAADLRRRLAQGEDFATLAEKHSDDAATRLRGGRPPDGFRVEELPAPLADAVLALDRGQVSEPLEQDGSIYLVEVTDRRVTPFERVAADLRQELAQRRPTEVEIAEKKLALTRGVRVRVLPAMFLE